jgi:putative ABC transport system permease protein
LSPGTIPRLGETSLDFAVVGFTFVVSILTGIFFGLIPALQLLRTDLNETLNESGRGTSASGAHARFRNSLVVTEVALAFLLFIASGLMMKSFIRVLLVEPGLNPVNLLTAEIALSGKYEDPKLQTAFLKQVVEHTKTLPGVESVAGTSILPLSGGMSSTYFNVVGEPQLPMDRAPGANFRAITPGFLHTMGIPLIKGRDLTEQDDGREPKALLISQSMAQKYWKGKNPIGLQLKLAYGPGFVTREIVGIVGDVKTLALDQPAEPEMYWPQWENPEYFMYLLVRTKTNPMGLAKLIQHEVAQLDKDQPVANIKTMENFFEANVAPRKFSVFLITVFAGIALVLSSIGIYSVISYSVSQRRNELGIRMALGATARDILRLVVGQGFKLIALGIAIGLAAALALTRLLASMLFNVSTRDPFIFIAISLVLAFVALLASYIPARRATRVDPMRALRYE